MWQSRPVHTVSKGTKMKSILPIKLEMRRSFLVYRVNHKPLPPEGGAVDDEIQQLRWAAPWPPNRARGPVAGSSWGCSAMLVL